MGAYIFYKLEDKEKADEITEFIEEQEEQKELNKSNTGIYFDNSEDINISQKNQEQFWINYYTKNKGKGNWKSSGVNYSEDIFEQVAELFHKMHKKFKLKIYCRSCSLKLDYFNKNQLIKITNKGKSLSGTKKFPKEYEQIINIIS